MLVADLYAACGLTPVDAQRERLTGMMAALQPRQPWLQTFRDHVLAQLAARKSPAPLKLEDPAGAAAVLQALAAIDGLAASTWERHLSVQVFGDSKRFEAVRRPVIAVLKRFSPLVPPDADDRTVLRLHRVERTPELIHLAGPLTLRTPDGLIELGAMRPYGAFPAVLDVVGWSATARVVVTVENLTPFVTLAAHAPQDVAVAYTGGFASPGLLSWLRALADAVPTLIWWHWGDIDVGGFRILAQLRGTILNLRPLAMDETTLAAHPTHAEPLGETELSALDLLLTEPHLADCRGVLQILRERRQKLEQEVVPVTQVLDQLRRL
jgi:hypothetical protein